VAEYDRRKAKLRAQVLNPLPPPRQPETPKPTFARLVAVAIQHYVKTKNGSSRHVHLNPAALEALERLRAEHTRLRLPANATLFLSQQDGEGDNPREIRNPRKWFSTALKRAGIPEGIQHVHWHTLRHTFASRLVQRGVSLSEVSELMGHKTLAMKKRYAHLHNANHQAALALLVPVVAVTVSDTMQHGAVGTHPAQSGTQNGYPIKNGATKKQTASSGK